MPKCTDGSMDLGRVGRRVIEANFEGGDIGSDGGVLLLRKRLPIPPCYQSKDRSMMSS